MSSATMMTIFGFVDGDCATDEETKAETISNKGRKRFLKIRRPPEQKSDFVGAVPAEVLEHANIATRVSAP